MNPFNWLKPLRSNQTIARPRGSRKLLVELLEDRLTPSHTASIVVPPTLVVSNVPEGSVVNLSSLVSGTGAGPVTYDWEVTGAVSVIGSNTGTSFSFTALDNGPVHVTLAVTDASDPLVTDVANAAPVDLTVTNVAPQNLAITGPDIGVRGQTLTYTSNFTDPGVNDTFTYAWSVTRNGAPYVLPAGTITNQPTFTFTPTFAGSYVVSLTVTDNAGAATTATHNLSVVAVTMEGNDLFVGGTTQSDHIVFVPNPMHVPGGGKPVMGVRVFINSVSYGTFQVPGSIIAFGQTGNDNIQTAGSIQNDTILFGGGGNDRLKGGAGNNVLVGGDGNDLLLGGRNNDIIIGGNGLDRINGGAGDDILIGDRTTFDTDYVVLGKIMDEWSSSSSYADRVSHLSGTTGGLNDGNFLLVSGVGQTVQDDGSIDRMQGAAGMDWFLSAAGTDLTFGKHPDEQLNN